MNSSVAIIERRAVILSLVVSIVLTGIKFAAYVTTGSSAVLSDALENIVNVIAAAFALYAVILAHAPADREHPYGHGKIEFLSAAIEGGMILLAAIVIAAQAVGQLWIGPKVTGVESGLWLIAVALVVNGVTGVSLIRKGRSSGSITLEADGKHLLTDAVTSGVVLIALGVVKVTGWTHADPIAAICVAVYIAFVAVKLLRTAAAGLMDEQDLTDTARLESILDAHVAGTAPQICSYHKLRHRHSGRYHWVDFHMVVPSDWDIATAHRAASAIEYEIEQDLGEGNATAHVEPCGDDACFRCRTD